MTGVRLAMVGDMHVADLAAANPDDRANRGRFLGGLGPIKDVFSYLNQSGVDHVFFLGDLVDWFSEANARLALDWLTTLQMPWTLTPGNHDYEGPPCPRYHLLRDDSRRWWAGQNLPLRDCMVDFPGTRVLVVDSALSAVGVGAAEWTRQHATSGRRNIIVTHVPIHCPPVIATIRAKDPHRGLEKYTQSGSPNYFDEALNGRVSDVFTGHLHFSAQAESSGTTFHMVPLGRNRDAAGGFPGIRIVACD